MARTCVAAGTPAPCPRQPLAWQALFFFYLLLAQAAAASTQAARLIGIACCLQQERGGGRALGGGTLHLRHTPAPCTLLRLHTQLILVRFLAGLIFIMPPKFDPSAVQYVCLRAIGGEVGATSSLAPKIGPLGLSPKKVGDDIAKGTKDFMGLKVTVKLTIANRKATVSVVPSAAALVIRALKEPKRDRKKEKNGAYNPPFPAGLQHPAYRAYTCASLVWLVSAGWVGIANLPPVPQARRRRATRRIAAADVPRQGGRRGCASRHAPHHTLACITAACCWIWGNGTGFPPQTGSPNCFAPLPLQSSTTATCP